MDGYTRSKLGGDLVFLLSSNVLYGGTIAMGGSAVVLIDILPMITSFDPFKLMKVFNASS